MNLDFATKQIAEDLGLSEVDAYIMVGTSKRRINRIGHHGENNVSIEFLIKLITALER